MTIRDVRAASTLALLTLLAAALPAACGSQLEGVCDDMCDCTGCSPETYDACVEETDSARKQAESKGCADVFDVYIACVDDELECKEDEFAFDGCDLEEQKLRECGVSVFRTVCELADEKLRDECGFDVSSSPDAECTGDVECQSRCILETTCEGLNGADPNEANAFIQCVETC